MKYFLVQLFQNLIGNSIKHMDKPQGEIKIACIEKGTKWEFSITDNGPGIEEIYFERIFTIFQTLKARDEFESTGIGLTLVKNSGTITAYKLSISLEKIGFVTYSLPELTPALNMIPLQI